MTRTLASLCLTGSFLAADPAAAQTPPTAATPSTAATRALTPPPTQPTMKPATKPGDPIPRTVLGRAMPLGMEVAGRSLTIAGDGSSAILHINPAKTADGKPATTIDQRRGHFTLRIGQTLVGDFQFEASFDFQTLPEKVRDGGWGVAAGIGVDGLSGVGGGGMKRGIFELTGPSYHLIRDIPNGSGTTWAYDTVPSKSKQVRMGLRRQGSDLIQLAADGPGEPLVEVRRDRFTDKPVSGVYIYATTGGSDVALAAKVSEVKLLTGADVPPAPAKSKVTAVVMVPSHDPVANTTMRVEPGGSGSLADGAVVMSTPVRGGGWGLPLATGLAGLLIGTLGGRWWGSRTEAAGDE